MQAQRESLELALCYPMTNMQTVETIRRQKLAELVQEAGSVRALADQLGRSSSQLSQWLNASPDSRSGKPRTINNASARAIERACHRPEGWMDQPPVTVGEDTAAYTVSAPDRPGAIQAPVFDARASMGHGLAMPESDTVVGGLSLSKEWVHSHLGGLTSPKNLAVISAYGDSMSPTFADGDMLLVDRGVESIRLDAVYVLELAGELYIKRLQRRPGGSVLMISDNKAYEPHEIKNGELERFRVLGRVLWAWRGQKL